MNRAERIGKLMFRYTRSELSNKEKAELLAWRNASSNNEALFQKETDPEHIRKEMTLLFDAEARAFEKFKQLHPGVQEPKPKIIHSRVYYITRIAASAILILGLAYLLVPVSSHELEPGSYQAGLVTLGKASYVLNDINRGFLTGRAGIRIREQANGELLYIAPNDSGDPKDKFNTLFTPRGGMFSLRLPDGTMVWLNAGSKITYPANFSQDSILVTIEGEAYFEVAPQHKSGYFIRIDSVQIKTPGAHMNIRSYAGEPPLITLTQGIANVRMNRKFPDADSSEVLLHLPGQVKITPDEIIKNFNPEVLTVENISDVVAWKNGRISFHNAPIQKIMNDIARWYDAEVIYAGHIPDRGFNLDLPRDAKFRKVEDALHAQGAYLTVKKRTITVSF
jgi:transmembrane sensor